MTVLVAWLLVSCHDRVVNPNANLTLDDYAQFDSTALRIHSRAVRHELEWQALHDEDSTWADRHVRYYYLRHRPMVWVSRLGVDARADSVLARLKTVSRMGFNENKFCVPQIERDLRRMRQLSFDDSTNSISRVAARLEYHLTKGYMRYVVGQQYGFVNPYDLFNHLDERKTDGPAHVYYTLFDLPVHRAGWDFFNKALHKVSCDSVAPFMAEVCPVSPFYGDLEHHLNGQTDGERFQRAKILVNMERCRWRMDDYPQAHKKYVVVNIPSFRLQAVDGDDVLGMRIGCGTQETKTPLLASRINRMDINPQWILPKSIVKKSVVPHAGNRHYFDSHHFFVRERSTGKIVEPGRVGSGMLLGDDYLVIQEGGEGNALGRIIFRFDNKFSVYLHSTSQPGVFSREDRGVSHGCVRVEKPFDLAVFMLESKDPSTIRKIRYSMSADVSPVGKSRSQLTEEQQQVADTLQRKMLVGNLDVSPSVPLYIVYFTLYPNREGRIDSFDDVYGYDRVVYEYLKNYL
jgi:murein L,D-transpeptidase YcbB/YkuD